MTLDPESLKELLEHYRDQVESLEGLVGTEDEWAQATWVRFREKLDVVERGEDLGERESLSATIVRLDKEKTELQARILELETRLAAAGDIATGVRP